MGQAPPGAGADGFNQQWSYQSTIDPEELFRKIFGDGFGSRGASNFDDFAESSFGFGEAQEVRQSEMTFLLLIVLCICRS